MAGCAVDQATIVRTIAFHGHRCPGLSIGIRASEIALREVGSSLDEEVVAVTETDMCAVDAVQFLTGCTFGKGNLLFLDHGKIAFSFFRRSDGKSLRILAKHAPRPDDRARLELRMRRASGHATPEEEKAFDAARFFHAKSLILCGGVACNGCLREHFEAGAPKNVKVLLAPRKYCTDNAAMIACSVAVLVPEPANMPSASSSLTPASGTSASATQPAPRTPRKAETLALIPSGLVRPLKNWAPYWMPTP